MSPDEVELIERTVRLRISRDTMHLWEAMAARMGLTLEELAQALVMYGAWLLASADMGLLEGIDLAQLTPEIMRATFIPWLERHGGQPAQTWEQCDHPCETFLAGFPCRCGTPERET